MVYGPASSFVWGAPRQTSDIGLGALAGGGQYSGVPGQTAGWGDIFSSALAPASSAGGLGTLGTMLANPYAGIALATLGALLGGGDTSSSTKGKSTTTPFFTDRGKYAEALGVDLGQLNSRNQTVTGLPNFNADLLSNYMNDTPYGRMIAGGAREPRDAYANIDPYQVSTEEAAAAQARVDAGSGYRPPWLDGAMGFGGTTRRPGTYLVGERGPEILKLPGAANVTPMQSFGTRPPDNNPVPDIRPGMGLSDAVLAPAMDTSTPAVRNETGVTPGTASTAIAPAAQTALPNAFSPQQLQQLKARAYAGAMVARKNKNAQMQGSQAAYGGFAPNLAAMTTLDANREAGSDAANAALDAEMQGMTLGTSQFNTMLALLMNSLNQYGNSTMTPPLGQTTKNKSKTKSSGGGGSFF